jgi:rod shape-determining protein MreB
MAKPENFLTSCDIGSSKICVLIGEQNSHGGLDVIGKGASPNRGTRKGNIINVDATIEAIKRAAEEAEIMAGVQIARAWVGISGSNVRSFNSRGVVAVAGKEREISREDVTRVIDAARGVQIPQDHEVVHVVPREFAVDGQDGVGDPTGMVGSRLEADVHVVTAPVAVTQNIVTCMNKAGIEVVELVLEQFAAAEAVLTEDEKELGIVLIDIGGGTTEVAVISLGGIVVNHSIRVAGDEIDESIIHYARRDHNLVIGERTAENAKIAAGSAYPLEEEKRVTLRGRDLLTGLPKSVEVSSVEIRDAISGPVNTIVEIVKTCVEETPPELVADIMEQGIFLAGGGALLLGLDRRLQAELRMPVRKAEDPLTCVARGTGRVAEALHLYSRALAGGQELRRGA